MKAIGTSESTPISADILTSDLLHQPGQIAMTMAPGKQDEEADFLWHRDLQVDLKRLRTYYGVKRLVCLLETEELCALGIPELFAEAEALGISIESRKLYNGDSNYLWVSSSSPGNFFFFFLKSQRKGQPI